MSQSEQQKQQQKVVQYLNEAHATEQALTRVLQSQIAMTPRGAYRTALETHLRETRDHAERVARRLEALGQGSNPLLAVVGAVEAVVGQALALGKTPFDLLRGSGGEEKVLKNAKDAYATEALEIATYTALERLASSVGDDETAKLAASILADEEKMLERILREIPKLTDAVVRRRDQGQAVLRHHHDRCGRHRPRRRRGDQGDRTQDGLQRQADRAQGPQGPGRRPGRGSDQGRRGLRGGPGDRALRLAHRRRDHEPADRALPDRPRQGRLLRAPQPEPHHRPEPDQHAARQRAVGGLRRAQRAAEVQAALAEGDDDRAKQRARPTSARTRTAPACCRPPSASSPTPEPESRPSGERQGGGPRVASLASGDCLTRKLAAQAPALKGGDCRSFPEFVATSRRDGARTIVYFGGEWDCANDRLARAELEIALDRGGDELILYLRDLTSMDARGVHVCSTLAPRAAPGNGACSSCRPPTACSASWRTAASTALRARGPSKRRRPRVRGAADRIRAGLSAPVENRGLAERAGLRG